MFKPILIASVLLASAAGLWFFGGTGQDEHRHALHKTLENFGFTGPIVPQDEDGKAPFIYTKIPLDQDEFGRIKEVRISPSGVFGGDRFKRLEIEGLGLTGELSDDDGISLSGLVKDNKLKSLQGFLEILNLADILVLQKARIDILTQKLGGIGGEADLELRRDSDTIRITGEFRSLQKQFSLQGKISGSVSPDTGRWELALDIEQGKSDIEKILLSRLYGEISMEGTGWTPSSLYGQMSAGSMVFHGYALQAPSFTFEKRGARFKLLAEAKHSPDKANPDNGLEFSFLYAGTNPDKIQVSVFSPDTAQLMDYLKIPPESIDIAPVKGLKNISLTLETPLFLDGTEEIRIPFIVKNQDDTSETGGFAVLTRSKTEEKISIQNIFWKDSL